MAARKTARDREEDQTVRISKTMSYILRHGAVKEGLSIRQDGFMELSVLLNSRPMQKLGHVTVDDIKRVVETNDKKRFVLREEDGKLWIRANQGHSIKVEQLELKKITLDDVAKYPVIVHGTYFHAWDSIRRTGLSKMSRNHIHFAKGEFGSKVVISGMRKSAQVLVYVDLHKALRDGIEFFESDNGVILTAGVNGVLGVQYFSRVVRATDGHVLYEPAGEKHE